MYRSQCGGILTSVAEVKNAVIASRRSSVGKSQPKECSLTHVPELGVAVRRDRAVKECLLPGHGPLRIASALLLGSAWDTRQTLTGKGVVAEREGIVSCKGESASQHVAS